MTTFLKIAYNSYLHKNEIFGNWNNSSFTTTLFLFFSPSSCRHGRDVSLKISVGFGMHALVGRAIPQLLLSGNLLSFSMRLLMLGLKAWSFSTMALLTLRGIPQTEDVASRHLQTLPWWAIHMQHCPVEREVLERTFTGTWVLGGVS